MRSIGNTFDFINYLGEFSRNVFEHSDFSTIRGVIIALLVNSVAMKVISVAIKVISVAIKVISVAILAI